MLHRREVLLGAVAASIGGFRALADAPSDAAIGAILQERVGKDQQSIGVVVVVGDGAGSRLVAYGASGTPDNRKLDGDTVFEIGSITKVLTALILADMAERSEVAMTDPVVKYLPASVKVPEYQGKPITLLDLATYTSGLPNMSDNFAPKDPLNPFADYTVDQLYAFLSGYTLKYEPGTHYEYANLGFGLLGHALARRAGKSYEALLVERICDPLDLRSTRITNDRRYAIASSAGSQQASGTGAAMGSPDAGRLRRRAFDGERPDRVPRSLAGTPTDTVGAAASQASRNPAADRHSRPRNGPRLVCFPAIMATRLPGSRERPAAFSHSSASRQAAIGARSSYRILFATIPAVSDWI
jgi:CubicO group peptidase (beta-lactamase class C family)